MYQHIKGNHAEKCNTISGGGAANADDGHSGIEAEDDAGNADDDHPATEYSTSNLELNSKTDNNKAENDCGKDDIDSILQQMSDEEEEVEEHGVQIEIKEEGVHSSTTRSMRKLLPMIR